MIGVCGDHAKQESASTEEAGFGRRCCMMKNRRQPEANRSLSNLMQAAECVLTGRRTVSCRSWRSICGVRWLPSLLSPEGVSILRPLLSPDRQDAARGPLPLAGVPMRQGAQARFEFNCIWNETMS